MPSLSVKPRRKKSRHKGKGSPASHSRKPSAGLPTAKSLTIHDLGWTPERAKEVRAKLSAFAADWDDPAMDVYDES